MFCNSCGYSTSVMALCCWSAKLVGVCFSSSLLNNIFLLLAGGGRACLVQVPTYLLPVVSARRNTSAETGKKQGFPWFPLVWGECLWLIDHNVFYIWNILHGLKIIHNAYFGLWEEYGYSGMIASYVSVGENSLVICTGFCIKWGILWQNSKGFCITHRFALSGGVDCW